jgi:phosphatidate cytidylyltransferase
MAVRAMTGAAYVGLTLGAAWAGPFTTYLLFLPVAVIAAFELHRLLWQEGHVLSAVWCMAAVAVVYTSASLGVFDGEEYRTISVVIAFTMLVLTVAWILKQGSKDPAADLGGFLLQVVLVALPFSAMINLFAHGAVVFVGFMVMLWTADTGAYLVGRSMGRTKLLPSVSPNKTIEGFIGGVIATIGVAYLFARYQPALDTSTWIICGAIVAVTSTLGDLLESSFKRARGVKDSGGILPGHGGMLDRFDGALLAAPAMLLYLALAH